MRGMDATILWGALGSVLDLQDDEFARLQRQHGHQREGYHEERDGGEVEAAEDQQSIPSTHCATCVSTCLGSRAPAAAEWCEGFCELGGVAEAALELLGRAVERERFAGWGGRMGKARQANMRYCETQGRMTCIARSSSPQAGFPAA